MERMNKFLEIFWLVISIISVILVVYVYSAIGYEDNLILIFFPVIAVGMYVFRRKMRKRFEDKRNNNQNRL